MKKILSFVIVFITNYVFAQITLEKSFAEGDEVYVYNNDNTLIYLTKTKNTLNIYNADYSLRKTINLPIKDGEGAFFWYDPDGVNYSISRHIFNTDDQYEFLITIYKYDFSTNEDYNKLVLINEDGTIIKDFHPDISTKNYAGGHRTYTDPITGINKIIVKNRLNVMVDGSYLIDYDVYSLPTSGLGSKELINKTRLTAFPIPTNKSLNIINPRNGSNTVEIFDASGKLLINKIFDNSENRIFIDVEHLSKGTFVYKIGNLSSKFIKN